MDVVSRSHYVSAISDLSTDDRDARGMKGDEEREKERDDRGAVSGRRAEGLRAVEFVPRVKIRRDDRRHTV